MSAGRPLERPRCRVDRLQRRSHRARKDCRAYWGYGVAAFAAGCATDVAFNHVGTFQGTTEAAAVECLRARIVGVRWDCMVPDGWTRLTIGSCTLE